MTSGHQPDSGMPDDGIIYVVDDDSEIRDALSSLLRSIGLRVETFGSAREFLAASRPEIPACLILDVRLRESSGLDLADELRNLDIPLPVIFITGHGTIPMSVQAMKSGALEFLTKPFSDEDLLAAVKIALDRDRAARIHRSQAAEARHRIDRLTPREHEVLDLVVAGKLNKQIAAELGTAEQTIKQHRGRVMRKLVVDSVADLVRLMERASGQMRTSSTSHLDASPARPEIPSSEIPSSYEGSMAATMSERVASFMIDAGATIAVVDDDPGVLTALQQLLRAGGFNAETFESAEEFLALANLGKIACLIVDINLPGVNGVDLVKWLSADGEKFPAILITGRDDATTERLLREAADVPKLHKPFSDSDLFEAIMLAMHQ